MAQIAETPKIQIPNQSQKEELINFLRKFKISFEIEKNEIRIYGLVTYINLYIVSEIIIYQNKIKISYEEFLDYNRILIETENELKQFLLDKTINAEYKAPYLIIRF